MSFILDALKKSENERQRTIGPSLADAPARRYQSDRPWWAVAVGALLIVNLGVLMVVLNRDDAAVTPATNATAVMQPAQQPLPSSAASMAAAPARRTSSDPAVHSLAEAAGVSSDSGGDSYYADSDEPAAGSDDPYADQPGLDAAAGVPSGPPIVRPIDPPAVAPLGSQPTFESRSAAADRNEVLPTATALTATGTSIPDLRLDIHVYSNDPAERFVFVNMRKYTEGQMLSEGPTIERITPDGAVLNQQGLRFLLPRQ